MDLLTALAQAFPYALGVLLLLVLLVAIGLWLLVRRARLGEGGGTAAGPQGWRGRIAADLRLFGSPALRQSLDASLARLERAIPGPRGRYRLPWYFLMGEAGAGKTTLLQLCGLDLPLGEPPAGAGPCGWWSFQRGLVLDVSGDLVLRRDGRTSDGETWRLLLRWIERHRSRRPLDGILLALPATALYDLDGQGAALLDEAAQRSAALHRKLWDVESTLGMRLPVYLVVTQCDLLPGFSAFADLLPEDAGGQMLGWSCADSPGTAYGPAWVDRIFGQLVSRFNQALAEVLGGSSHPAAAQEAFQAARSVAALRETVRVYLNQIFLPSAYHEPFDLRGLYLVGGRFEAGAAAAATAQTIAPWGGQPTPTPGGHGGERPARILFTRDLVSDKVFAEAPVGRPTAAALRQRRKDRLALQGTFAALLLLAALGLPAAARSTSRRAGVLTPFVEQILRDLTELREPARRPDPPARDRREPMLRRLLQPARTIEDYGVRSPLLPASWLSPLDRELRRDVVKAYDRIALPAVRNSLTSRLAALGQTVDLRLQTYDAAPTFYDRTAELQDFQGFLADLHAAEARVASFDCIAQTCTWRGDRLLGHFNNLTTSCFQEPFAPPGWSAARFYERVLKAVAVKAIAYPPAGDDFGLQDRAILLNRRFDSRLLVHNALAGDLDTLAVELRLLEAQRDTIADVESYHRLLDLIAKTQEDLGQPELAWTAKPKLELGAAYEKTLTAVHDARFLGPQLAADFRTAGDDGFRDLKVRLRAFSTPYTGPLLAQQDGQVQLKLSKGVLQLQSALQGLFDQGFMAGEAPRLNVPPQPGESVLFWDANLLQQALSQVQPYQEFLAKGLTLFPTTLRSQVSEVAHENLRRQMIDTIVRAQQWKTRATFRVPDLLQASLGSQVGSFQTAAPILSSLQGTLAALGFPTDAADLTAVVDEQRGEILAQTDDLLALSSVYRVADPPFSWWRGKSGLAFGAFAVTDTAGLNAYLDSQRQTITTLAASYAAPALGGAGLIAPLGGPRATRWKTILDDLDAYKGKQAGNPLQSLETLIAQTLPALTRETCLTQLPAADLETASTDFFATRRSALARGVHGRCLTLASCYFRYGYHKLSQDFNGRLAGRFPFSPREPGRPDGQALPAAIADIYSLFDKYQSYLAQLPAGALAIDGENEVRAFMAALKAVRPLFAPYLDEPQKYPAPVLGFNVEFRVNQANEEGAGEILHWRLDVGEARFQNGDTQLKGQWTYGSSSALRLVWAESSPHVPVAATSSGWAAVDHRAVTYQYAHPWSLLALIRDSPSAPGDFRDPTDNRPETLKLEIQTRPEQKPPLATTGAARAFVRVTLLTPDGKKQLELHDFPQQAPPGAPRCAEDDDE